MFEEAYQAKNVKIKYKLITKKEYKKIVAELAQLFYDEYCQRSQKLIKPTIEISTSCTNKEAA